MSRHEILNNVDHKDLRVSTRYSAYPGNNIMCCQAIPGEFRDLQAEYVIFLHRDNASGKTMPVVMLGLQRDENLYLGDSGWQASYIPLMIERGPFLIGFQPQGDGGKTRVISIDMDDPRVNRAEGEPVFQPFGGNTAYTDRIADVLSRIDEGQADIEQLCQALDEHDLIEPFSLDLQLSDGTKHKLTGFHTIHEERLACLDGETLADLSRRGILQAAYMMIASIPNIRRLVEFKNALL